MSSRSAKYPSESWHPGAASSPRTCSASAGRIGCGPPAGRSAAVRVSAATAIPSSSNVVAIRPAASVEVNRIDPGTPRKPSQTCASTCRTDGRPSTSSGSTISRAVPAAVAAPSPTAKTAPVRRVLRGFRAPVNAGRVTSNSASTPADSSASSTSSPFTRCRPTSARARDHRHLPGPVLALPQPARQRQQHQAEGGGDAGGDAGSRVRQHLDQPLQPMVNRREDRAHDTDDAEQGHHPGRPRGPPVGPLGPEPAGRGRRRGREANALLGRAGERCCDFAVKPDPRSDAGHGSPSLVWKMSSPARPAEPVKSHSAQAD